MMYLQARRFSASDSTLEGICMVFTHSPKASIEKVGLGCGAHESSHAAKAIFRYIGADIDSDECFEYLVGWIAKNCGKTKDAFGKKSKSKRG